MTPDELRALADALAEYAESPDRVSHQAEPILQAAGYLRACADEKPAVWVDSIARPQPHAVTKLTYRSAHDARDGVEYVPLYTHLAPAAPQSEPKMLTDEEIRDLWSCASAQDQGPETTQQHTFARAVEREAYRRAAAEITALRDAASELVALAESGSVTGTTMADRVRVDTLIGNLRDAMKEQK